MLHLETGRHLYGGARQAGYLVAELNRQGVDSRLVCEPAHPLTAMLPADAAVACHCRGDLDPAYYRRLRRIIRASGADIVHVHSRRGADSLGGLAARAEGVPAVLTRRVESREPRFWLRLKCRPYAAIVAISGAVQAELEAAGVPPARLRRIPSAVDTLLFRPDAAARARLIERYALPADAVIAACAAQLIARKGLAGLLDCLPRILDSQPRFRLLLFGQGPLRRRLERRARGLGITGQLRFCGFASDWPALLPGLDLLMHPARREGLGSVLLEAMSAGVPVLAAAAGGIGELLEDGVDGRLIDPESDTGWIEAAVTLASDPNARRQLAAAARRKLERRFTITAMAERYLEVYRHVLTPVGRA